MATQWAKLLQLGPQLEISETGLLKRIVNSASSACEIHALSMSLSIYYSLFMEIYSTTYKKLKKIKKIKCSCVEVISMGFFIFIVLISGMFLI